MPAADRFDRLCGIACDQVRGGVPGQSGRSVPNWEKAWQKAEANSTTGLHDGVAPLCPIHNAVGQEDSCLPAKEAWRLRSFVTHLSLTRELI